MGDGPWSKQMILRSVSAAAGGVLLAGVGSVALLAQWLRYPTPGVPRPAAGKPVFSWQRMQSRPQ